MTNAKPTATPQHESMPLPVLESSSDTQLIASSTLSDSEAPSQATDEPTSEIPIQATNESTSEAPTATRISSGQKATTTALSKSKGKTRSTTLKATKTTALSKAKTTLKKSKATTVSPESETTAVGQKTGETKTKLSGASKKTKATSAAASTERTKTKTPVASKKTKAITSAAPKTEVTKTKASAAPKKTKSPHARRDENSLSRRAYDDRGNGNGYFPWDLVPADNEKTLFIDMSQSAYWNPGSYLWTQGLATCVGIAVYHRRSADPYNSRKILAHASATTYRDTLQHIDDYITKNFASARNSRNFQIIIVAPNTLLPQAGWSDPNMIAVLNTVIDEIRGHFPARYPRANVTLFSSTRNDAAIEAQFRTGEMIIDYANRIYIDGNPQFINTWHVPSA